MDALTVVGKPAPRVDAREKVTGGAVYSTDVQIPGMLHGLLLRSSLPHARIARLDTSEAERLPGVRAVVTGRDCPGVRLGSLVKDAYVLAQDRVRFVGDEVAAVAAEDPETAARALDLIRIEWEELPPVFSAEEALQTGAPRIHEERVLPPEPPLTHDPSRNVGVRIYIRKGDVEGAFAKADRVFEGRFETPIVHQGYLEPNCVVASWDSHGRLTAYASSMYTSGLRQDYADVFGIPVSQVRVIGTTVGGAFGGKISFQPLHAAAALLARKAGAPVRLANSREEEFTAGRPRASSVIEVQTAVRGDGKLLGRKVRFIGDCGAYTHTAAPMLIVLSGRSDNLYRIGAIETDAAMVYTNKTPIGAYRGYGNPQMTFALESQLEEIADALGMDPAELRLRNASQPGDTGVHGWKITSCGFSEAIETVAARSGWSRRTPWAGTGRTSSREEPLRGLGMACMIHECDDRHAKGFAGSVASVALREDGRAQIVTGEGDYGQGSRTVYAQIAAEVLALNPEDVDQCAIDTDFTPYTLGPWGSRLTLSGGNAVRLAAEDARAQVLEEASRLLEVAEEDLALREGHVAVKGAPEKRLPLGEVVRSRMHKRNGSPIVGRGVEEPDTTPLDPTRQTNPCSTYSFAAQVAEVEVNPQTGQVKVLHIHAANDAGTPINPLALTGQIEGGVLQGLGQALFEELRYEEGKILNPSFLYSGMPLGTEAPLIDCTFIETKDPYGPFGAKGGGELGLTPVPAAVANAVQNACGVRIRSLPLTAEKVLRALRTRRRGKGSAGRPG
ncbi:MAG: xanthine dehydrogenase family protein molybdopterin-binding subunit [Candidatus Tectomicrobia bacterium]|nr:xanthine dehydrogenase family protein molybdopterin-binding subunit [Candidatus Tectomicrobia bacterium]